MTPHRPTDRVFGFTFAAVFAVIAAIGWLAFGVLLDWMLILSSAFLIMALVAPWLLLPLNCLWAAITVHLGRVLNFVILTGFFYLIMLPVGLVLRLTGRDPLPRGADPRSESYWGPVGRHTDAETLKDMF